MLITWLEGCSKAVQTVIEMDGFLSTLLQLATKRSVLGSFSAFYWLPLQYALMANNSCASSYR